MKMYYRNGLAYIFTFIISINCFQEIPAGVNAIIVKNVSFQSVINTLPKFGYDIAKLDRKAQRVESQYKFVEGTITHMSIIVQMKNGDAIVTGRWWTNLAPPKGDFSKSEDVTNVENGFGQQSKFKVMNKFCELLKGKIIYIRLQ